MQNDRRGVWHPKVSTTKQRWLAITGSIQVVDGYKLDGSQFSHNENNAFTAPAWALLTVVLPSVLSWL